MQTQHLRTPQPPFGGCGDATPYNLLRQNIMRGSYKFAPAEVWDKVSPEARAFIRTLLVVNPLRRPTAQEAQNHPWLKTWAERSQNGNDTELNPNVVHALVNFKGLSDIRRLLSEVLSFTLLPDQIKGLRSEFEKMDSDGSGEISLEALERVLISSAGTGSLGELSSEEIHDIFHAMSVTKGSKIHWHEFLAATLSQCQVDDRNLRQAFERLDSDHKGVSSKLIFKW
jgi:calcium-dependent protein kinase